MGRSFNWVEILDVPAAQRNHSERIRNARTAASISADVVLLEREQRKDSVRVDTDFKSSPYETVMLIEQYQRTTRGTT